MTARRNGYVFDKSPTRV